MLLLPACYELYILTFMHSGIFSCGIIYLTFKSIANNFDFKTVLFKLFSSQYTN